MAFVLLGIGALLLIAGVRNQQQTLFGLVQKDFTGQGNFLYWLLACILIGAIGYIPKMQTVSRMFLGLLILVLVLKRGASGTGGGFFEQFTSALQGTQTGPPVASTGATTTTPTAGATGGAGAASATTTTPMPTGVLTNALSLPSLPSLSNPAFSL